MQTRGSGGAATGHSFNQQTVLNGQVQSLSEPSGHGERLDAKKGAVDAAIGHEIVCDSFGRVDGNGETDACGGASGRVDRGIDADSFAMTVDERAAGIAAVDRGVGLDGFINEGALAGLDRAADGADDAGRERALESERIADGQNFLPDLQRAGIA